MIRFFPKWRKIKFLFEEQINIRQKFLRTFENARKGYSSDTKSSHGCVSKPSEKKCQPDNKLKPRPLDEVLDLNCKASVVIGGADGIGYAAAHEILNNKAKFVGIFGKDVCRGMEACYALNCRFGKRRAIFSKVDVTNKSDIECAICKLTEEVGRIEIFVNSFGICDGKNWETELNTNLIGMTRCTIAAHKYLSESKKGGVILNCSGIFGIIPSAGLPTISAAQHGIIGLSKSFGKDTLFKHTNVRVITLCPGLTETKLFKEAKSRALTEFMGKCFQEEIEKMKKQRSEVCGSAIAWLIRYARSGSLWVLDGGELYKVNMKEPSCCMEWYNQFLL